LASKIFLTGTPGVGKTTVLRRIVQELRGKGILVGGMITEEVRERGVRVGFRVTDVLTGTEGWLASTKQAVGPRIGRYVVDLGGLEGIGVKALTNALSDSNVRVIVLDEVGPMELFSKEFKAAVRNTVSSTKSVIGTIHYRANDPLLHEIRAARGIKTVIVTMENRASLPTQIVEEVLSQMTSVEHSPD
jgi:nucleoside-triphosphatase